MTTNSNLAKSEGNGKLGKGKGSRRRVKPLTDETTQTTKSFVEDRHQSMEGQVQSAIQTAFESGKDLATQVSNARLAGYAEGTKQGLDEFMRVIDGLNDMTADLVVGITDDNGITSREWGGEIEGDNTDPET